ncbi:virulence factor Mce family protein [Thermomonospora echinospora]|uniref:Virulence factor Mce family protein n=1 Tax=Thermomonospora echinospora TaxID=1992 RepID=A0A1H5XCI0_9ACTN|nr:MCE family protein [Thermomonospora echinospora]SEG08916.1 virulence factor Mce family protein [Thermomonospora echinospora]
MRRLAATAFALALAASTGGCAVTEIGDDTYRITVYFAKTTSLYEQSRVKVMGADAGSITAIRGEGDRVRVDLTIDGSVPVHRDARAVIASANALGERYVQLEPAWRPGQPKAPPGMVIPKERTELPVEIDDALAAFARLNRSIDAQRLGTAVERGADGLRGHGDDLNEALRGTASLTHNLAAHDQRIVSLAEGLRTLAADLNRRDRRLGELIESFSTTSRSLAEERARLSEFVEGLAAVIRRSEVLITAYQETLPGAVTDLSNIVMTLKANAGALEQAITALGHFADVTVRAWDRKNHVATIRLVVHGTLRAWLQPLFTAMGWGTVPCLEGRPELATCTDPPGRTRP